MIKWVFVGIFAEAILVYFFYRNVIAVFCLAWIPCLLFYLQWENWHEQILFQIESGFKEWIQYIKGGLQTGKSVENAILSCRDSFCAHLGENHPFQLGMQQVYHGLELHIPIEVSISKLATETGLEVIEDFAMVFQITKKQGGRMINILERTITQIYEKAELREEIRTLFAAKKMEQRIMCAMPFAIMLFIGSTSKGYFDPLYNNLRGVCIMSVCLVIYLAGIWWGEKLTEVSI